MARLLLRRWWVILLQGILLIILSVFIFNNPETVLAGISIWFALIVIFTGMLGIISWMAAGKAEREDMSLLWSILTFIFGLLMLFHLLATMKIITVILGVWILISGVWLFKNGWSYKNGNPGGWIIIILGVLSVVVALMIIFNIGTGAVALSTLLALQLFLIGISLILLSFAKKIALGNIRGKIEDLR